MGSAAENTRPDRESQTGAECLPWPMVLWFGALLIACYAPVLRRLWNQWMDDPDMGHGVFVPLVVAYIVWQRRQELASTDPSPAWWGLLVVAFGALQLYVGTLGAELFLARTAFLISLAGAVLFLGGVRAGRKLVFPFFLLCFMIPIPAILFNQITLPLQLLASRLAEMTLSVLGIPVLREGNILELPTQLLSVVEACSGIRSLLSLSFLSLVYGYFFDERTWMRVLLFLSTAPIAIVANASRVTLTGVLGAYKPELAEGFFHNASGWVIFVSALAILVLFHQAVNRISRGWDGRR